MPIIYQCGNCGIDHEDVSQQRECKTCGNETCTNCQVSGSCWECNDNDRTVVDEPTDDDLYPSADDDIEWEDAE